MIKMLTIEINDTAINYMIYKTWDRQGFEIVAQNAFGGMRQNLYKRFATVEGCEEYIIGIAANKKKALEDLGIIANVIVK